MKSTTDLVFSICLTLAAVCVATAVVHKEFFAKASADASAVPVDSPVLIPEWQAISAGGIHFGPTEPSVVVTVFSDFECPFCRAFHQTLQSVREQQPGLVEVSFVHYPLSYHRFARPAAKAAECAAIQGHFESFADVVFGRQDSLGLVSWTHLARLAGVKSLDEFDSCVAGATTFARIDSGVATGKRLRLQGTPTVLINGWRLPGAPDSAELQAMIEAVSRGDAPTPTVR